MPRRALSASLTNVTKTARQWDAVFAMRVHSELLGKYTAPNVADDDEGYYLVGALVQEIDAALDGRMPSRLVSYGKFLALDFTFLARRRRTSSEEVLNLRLCLALATAAALCVRGKAGPAVLNVLEAHRLRS